MNASTGDKDQTLEYLEGTTILKSLDEYFQVEIILGFKGGWAEAISAPGKDGKKAAAKNKEIYGHIAGELTEFAVESMGRIGADLQVLPFGMVEKDPALNIRSYFLSRWKLNFPPEAKQNDLEFVFIISVPNEATIKKYMDAVADAPSLDSSDFSDVTEEAITDLMNSEEGESNEDDFEMDDAGNEEDFKKESKEEPRIKEQNGFESNVEFEPFAKSQNVKSFREVRNIDMLRDVEMEVSVEIGRKKIPLGKILQLVKGAVIELDKLSGEPVDILVNNRRIALGNVVVIDEHFGVRITNLLAEHTQLKQNA